MQAYHPRASSTQLAAWGGSFLGGATSKPTARIATRICLANMTAMRPAATCNVKNQQVTIMVTVVSMICHNLKWTRRSGLSSLAVSGTTGGVTVGITELLPEGARNSRNLIYRFALARSCARETINPHNIRTDTPYSLPPRQLPAKRPILAPANIVPKRPRR